MKADAYHIVDQGLAWYGRVLPKGARFVTVHDLINYLTCLGKLPFAPLSGRRDFLARKCVEEIKRADHVFAISEFTASSLMKYLDLQARKITVTPNCADPRFRPCSNAERGLARARLFGNDEYVIVCVGSSAEYKNRLGTLRVFNSLKKRLDSAQLHIAGGKASEIEKAYIEECRLQKSVHYWGHLPVEDLVLFYNGADALILTSLYEGFGLPPLEAMQCGCPVVSTTCASLREVVGAAALTVDNPAAVEIMAEYLQNVLKDKSLHRNLRALGLRQASQFTVERSMQSIAEVYQRLLA
jgi:glycosyltransferase involved in cell wall biosynthesis